MKYKWGNSGKGFYQPIGFKLKNYLQLVRLLSRRPQQLSALSRLFEVSERSIQRYLQALRKAGFAFKKCENKGWYAVKKWRF
jgi:predicted DNA-binding transcriptional regulator YafY